MRMAIAVFEIQENTQSKTDKLRSTRSQYDTIRYLFTTILFPPGGSGR
jgi:hypothetical protein